MITIHNLKKKFGAKTAIDIADYEITDGSIIGLVGNNGAGKTTLFRLLLDLLKPDEGEVSIDGVNPQCNETWKWTTGAFIDASFLIDYLTPEEYFLFTGKMYGLSQSQIKERLQDFERFMNNEILGQKKYIRSFSAGNKQKIGIIAAMLHQPRLLILAEPFNYLDPSSQSAIKHILQQYHRQHKATILISSHNLNYTVDISTRIAVLEKGHIIRDIENNEGSAEKELENYFFVDNENSPGTL